MDARGDDNTGATSGNDKLPNSLRKLVNVSDKEIAQRFDKLETLQVRNFEEERKTPKIPVEHDEPNVASMSENLVGNNTQDNTLLSETRQSIRPSQNTEISNEAAQNILSREEAFLPVETPVQILPNVNCSEKIVLCIDISAEMEKEQFKARAGTCYKGIDVIRKALKLYICNKELAGTVTGRHQFALVLLLDEALWVKDFTCDVVELYKHIDELTCLQTCYKQFNMSTLFDVILEKAKPPILENPRKDTPPFIVRVLLIYSRSHCQLVYTSHESQNLISALPCFFIDVLYLHEPPGPTNMCEEIYAELCDLDEKGFSHVYEVSKTPTKVFDAMAKLLGHPLQRAVQIDSGYKLQPVAMDIHDHIDLLA